MKRFVLLLTLLFAFITPVLAQAPQPRPVQGLRLPIPIGPRTDATDTNNSGGSIFNQGNDSNSLQNILGAFDDKLLADLQSAKRLADNAGNQLTGRCWQAWIERIEARKKSTVDEQGKPIELPDPHIITDFEKVMDLRNSLQPDSPFMQACQPVASVVRRDIAQLIGLVLGGGVGLMKLVPGL